MQFNRDEVNTDEEMIHHLWDANCSVCTKIAYRLKELSDLLKEKGDAEKVRDVSVPQVDRFSV